MVVVVVVVIFLFIGYGNGGHSEPTIDNSLNLVFGTEKNGLVADRCRLVEQCRIGR